MRSRYITLTSGLRVHYLEAGDRSHPTAVFLHGFPTDSRLWRHGLVPLAEEYHVVAPDLPGHGRTDGHPDLEHDLDYYVAWFGEFCDALGLMRTHLVSHDVGGMLALAFAGRHPERIDRFVVMDTGPYPNWSWQMRLTLLMVRLAPLRRLFLDRRVFRLALRLSTTRKKDVLERLVTVFHPSWTATPLRRRMFGRVCAVDTRRLCPTSHDLLRIDAPTLILWGERDPIFPLSVAKRLESDLADATLVSVPGSGHFVPEEEPALVVSQVRRFLSAPGVEISEPQTDAAANF